MAERARQLIQNPRAALEHLAGVAAAAAADPNAPWSQKLAASRALANYTLGKPKAGQPFAGAAGGTEAAPSRPFDPSKLKPERLRQYLDALKLVDEIETEAMGEPDAEPRRAS
jgi:hypothetical protein